jgi:hypothetical protein
MESSAPAMYIAGIAVMGTLTRYGNPNRNAAGQQRTGPSGRRAARLRSGISPGRTG